MHDKKILVVDDSESMRKLLVEIFKDAGFTNIIEASNGNAAVELYNAEHPDIVLLDIIMPDKNGVEVLREIGKGARVIVVSAVGQDAMVAEARKLGACDYVVKPVDPNDIVAKTMRCFDIK